MNTLIRDLYVLIFISYLFTIVSILCKLMNTLIRDLYELFKGATHLYQSQ